MPATLIGEPNFAIFSVSAWNVALSAVVIAAIAVKTGHIVCSPIRRTISLSTMAGRAKKVEPTDPSTKGSRQTILSFKSHSARQGKDEGRHGCNNIYCMLHGSTISFAE